MPLRGIQNVQTIFGLAWTALEISVVSELRTEIYAPGGSRDINVSIRTTLTTTAQTPFPRLSDLVSPPRSEISHACKGHFPHQLA